LKTGARYAERPDVALIAFAHEPTDARSACIAALDVQTDPVQAVARCLPLGPSVVFSWHRDRVQVFKQAVPTPQRVGDPVPPDKLDEFFATHQEELQPHTLYRVKTRGLLEAPKPRQLTFVDVGLMRLVDEDMGKELTRLVEHVVDRLRSAFTGQSDDSQQGMWMLEWAFRLLAGKILQDKEVRTFKGVDLLDYRSIWRLVGRHYARTGGPISVGDRKQQAALGEAAELVAGHAHLGRVTTEALADVYESAFVSRETRRALGTHSTPAYLADYMVWQLADWIEKTPLDKLRVFEPACGHSAFLVSVMRFIREAHPSLQTARRSRLYRERFCGIEVDPFALEIAKLSLTLADVPNPDGWEQIVHGDMFANACAPLRQGAEQCTLLLANPPFEDQKALGLLESSLPHLPPGAVFGVVVPATLLHSKGVRYKKILDFRRWLTNNCQLAEVSLFPDGLFRFADHECGVLLGRRLAQAGTAPTVVRCKRVREDEREGFKQRYEFPSDRRIQQHRFAERPECILWVPELDDEIWSWLRNCPRLTDVAYVSQGIAYKREKRDSQDSEGRPRGSKTIEDEPFPGSVAGYARIRGDWMTHGQPELSHLNVAEDVILRARLGADTGFAQVLMPRNPGRGIWRLRPFIDRKGRPFASNFLTVRPKDQGHHFLEYLCALCCSPLANAYVYTHTLKRNIQDGDLRELPIPHADQGDVRRVATATRDYLEAARRFQDGSPGDGTLALFPGSPTADRVDRETLHRLLRRMDAEVLRLYGLPVRAERALLDRFSGKVRPGVPGRFAAYYPDGFRNVLPLYVYLSQTYQRYLETGNAEVSDDIRRRYDELIDKRLANDLTAEQGDELYRLEAEMDASDYASRPLDDSWREAREAERRQAGKKLDRIANRIVDLAQTGGSADANRS